MRPRSDNNAQVVISGHLSLYGNASFPGATFTKGARFSEAPYTGDAIVPRTVYLDSIPNGSEISVSRPRRFKVILAEPWDWADAISAQDGNGRALRLIDTSSGTVDSRDRFPLQEGKSVVLTVGADAATLVFHKGHELVDSIPLDLVPGDTVRIER